MCRPEIARMWPRPEARIASCVVSEMPPRSPMISAAAMWPLSPGSAASMRRRIVSRRRASGRQADGERRRSELGRLGRAVGEAVPRRSARRRRRARNRSHRASPARSAAEPREHRHGVADRELVGLGADGDADVAGGSAAAIPAISWTRTMMRTPPRAASSRSAIQPVTVTVISRGSTGAATSSVRTLAARHRSDAAATARMRKRRCERARQGATTRTAASATSAGEQGSAGRAK